VLIGLVHRDVAVRLGPAFAVLVVTEPPKHINTVHGGLVLRDVAVRLRLAVALGAQFPLNADVVLVGLVRRDVGLVRRDVGILLGPVFAVLTVAEPPEHINIAHGGSVSLEGMLLLCLVLAAELPASMQNDADAMHVGSVHLDAALLLRLVRAVGLRAGHYAKLRQCRAHRLCAA